MVFMVEDAQDKIPNEGRVWGADNYLHVQATKIKLVHSRKYNSRDPNLSAKLILQVGFEL
jgi:hypothetical protein